MSTSVASEVHLYDDRNSDVDMPNPDFDKKNDIDLEGQDLLEEQRSNYHDAKIFSDVVVDVLERMFAKFNFNLSQSFEKQHALLEKSFSKPPTSVSPETPPHTPTSTPHSSESTNGPKARATTRKLDFSDDEAPKERTSPKDSKKSPKVTKKSSKKSKAKEESDCEISEESADDVEVFKTNLFYKTIIRYAEDKENWSLTQGGLFAATDMKQSTNALAKKLETMETKPDDKVLKECFDNILKLANKIAKSRRGTAVEKLTQGADLESLDKEIESTRKYIKKHFSK